MFKVLDKLHLGNMYCVSVEGDIKLLKNGLKLIDENGNTFEIRTIAMSKYKNIEDYEKYAELVLEGDIENIGKTLLFYNEIVTL